MQASRVLCCMQGRSGKNSSAKAALKKEHQSAEKAAEISLARKTRSMKRCYGDRRKSSKWQLLRSFNICENQRLLPYHTDVYCVNENAFRGTACAYERPFANINIRKPTTPILPLNWQNFFARWTSELYSGSYSTQLPQWPKRSVMKFWGRDSSKRFKTGTYFRKSEIIHIF